MSQIQGDSGSAVDPRSTDVPNGAPSVDPEGSYDPYSWPVDALQRVLDAIEEEL